MKSPWGNVVRIQGLLYGRPRDPYTRTHPYPATITHFKALPREKAAIIKLRNIGYSINQLSKAFGRSTSWIHTVLKTADPFRLVHVHDNRKLPRKGLLWGCKKRMISLFSWMKLWQAFIFGEEDDPP